VNGARGYIDVNTEVGPGVGRASGAPLDALTGEARSHGVGLSLVHSRAALLGDARSANDALLDRIAGVDGLLSVAVLSPDRSTSAAEVAALAPRVVAWWLHPTAAAVESLATDGLLAAAARSGKPVFVPIARFGDATRIGRATATLGVPIVLVGTHYSNVVDALAAARRYDQILLETSSMAHVAALETAVREIGAERLLFGTGSPMRAIQSGLNAVAVARIPDDAKRAILGGNAARLLGLTAPSSDLPAIRRAEGNVDVHAHLGPLEQDVPTWADDAFVAELRRQTGTAIAIASNVEAIESDLDAGNRNMVERVAATPGLLGHLVAYPDDVPGTREQVRRYGDKPNVIGVKIGCEQSSPTASRAVWDVFEVLADYGRPVKIHNDGAGWDEALRAIAVAHPHLPIIIAHGGLGTPSLEGAALTADLENVYLEMCSSFALLPTVREVVRRLPAERFLFGTDAPLIEPAFVLGTYQDSGLRLDQEDAVYRDNARRLFGLE
jgi:predicted TIM-barrel fold metal-dependent hydrolase